MVLCQEMLIERQKKVSQMVLMELTAYLGRQGVRHDDVVRGMREESQDAVDTCWRARR